MPLNVNSGRGTLLLVEDDAAVRESLLMLLSEHYDVDAAADAAAAMTLACTRRAQGLPPHDLLLIDLLLGSGPDGVECLRLLREHARRAGAEPPAIAFTGMVTPAAKKRCLGGGFSVILPKPFMIETLEANIEALLAERWDGPGSVWPLPRAERDRRLRL